MFKKNTAVTGFPIGHFVQTADGAAKTTGTPTCKRLLDGVGGTLTNAAAYDGTAGVWKIDLAAEDTNGDMVGLVFSLADCIPISYAIRTSTSLVSDVETDTADIQARLPAALIGGRIDASVGAMANDVLTPAAISLKAITSEAFDTGAITAAALATDAITAAALAADAAEEIADAVRTELAAELARIDAAVSTRLASAGYTAPPSAATIASTVDATLTAAHDGGSWAGTAAGEGTGTYTDTVTDGVDPLDNVLVQLSTDAAGTNMVYRTYTAADGTFTLYPDPGTYYVWLELAGYSFTQGAQVVVT